MTARDEKLNVGATEPKTAEQLQVEVDGLEEQIASLKAQIDMPLTTLEIAQLLAIVGEQKTKASDQQKRHVEDQLMAKLDSYLNPGLFDQAPKEE